MGEAERIIRALCTPRIPEFRSWLERIAGLSPSRSAHHSRCPVIGAHPCRLPTPLRNKMCMQVPTDPALAEHVHKIEGLFAEIQTLFFPARQPRVNAQATRSDSILSMMRGGLEHPASPWLGTDHSGGAGLWGPPLNPPNDGSIGRQSLSV